MHLFITLVNYGTNVSPYSGSLRCYPQPDSELPLEQPVQGQGLCGPRMDPEPPTGSPDAPREHASSGQ